MRSGRRRPTALEGLQPHRDRGPGLVALEAVAVAGRGGQGQVGPARRLDHVAHHPVARGGPEVLVQVGGDEDAVVGVVDHPVALDPESLPPPSRMPLPKVAHSSGTRRRGCGWPPPGCRRCRPGGTAAAARSRGCWGRSRPSCAARPSARSAVAAGVGARVAEGVVLGHHLVDDGVAGMALADVEAGVGRARGVGVLEQAVDRVEGVDAVVLVVVRGDIGGAVAAHAGPEQPVDERVADGQVLDRHPVGGHADPVGPPELAVDHHPVAVAAADGHRGHGDLDLLAVGARADQDQVAGPGVHRGLDGVVVLGHPPGHPAGPLHRLGPGRRPPGPGREVTSPTTMVAAMPWRPSPVAWKVQ